MKTAMWFVEVLGDVGDQAGLDGTFIGLVSQPAEFEQGRVLQGLARHLGVRCGESQLEVGRCGPYPLLELVADVGFQEGVRDQPPDRLLCIPQPLCRGCLACSDAPRCGLRAIGQQAVDQFVQVSTLARKGAYI